MYRMYGRCRAPAATRLGLSRSFSTKKPPAKSYKPVIIAVSVFGAAYLVDRQLYSSTIARSVHAVYVFSSVAVQYRYLSGRYDNMNDLHEKAADQLYDLLVQNKGLYIKFGQAIANQGAAFPIAFQKRFVKLYDAAPADPWPRVAKMLKKSLGNDFETRVFSDIDRNAVASGSIAQVHRAVLKETGEEVAVKVQHDYISKQVAADLLVYRAMTKIYQFVFEIPLSFYSSYVSEQTLKETRFDIELQNAETLRAWMANDPAVKSLNVYIPKNYPEHSDDKVLVSEWIDGVSLVEKQRIVDQKYDLTRIMDQLIKIFARQIFNYGFVHCDGHPGNIMVRRDKSGSQQLVLLDHGLYIKLRPKFKSEYCRLWRSMFALDLDDVRTIGRSWGVNSVDMFASMVQLKPLEDAQLQQNMSGENSKQMLMNFLSDFSKFPLELLFLGKTMRILQTTNKTYGSPVNRVNILTNEAITSLLKTETIGFEFLNLIKLKTMLFFSSVVFWFFRLRQILSGDRLGGKGRGLEDYMDDFFKKTAHDAGFEILD